MGQLLKAKEVAARLGCTSAQVYQLCKEGAISYVKIGVSVRIAEDALHSFIAAHTIPARATGTPVIEPPRKDTPINVRIAHKARQSR